MGEPSWADLAGAFELFRDPILCAVAAGAVLGFLGVFVVLRRMVFVTATLSQSAGLGVALSFYAQIHLGLLVDPTIGAVAGSLIASAVFVVRPQALSLSHESVLGLAYLAAGALAVMVGDRISQEAHEISSILFGSAVLVRPADLWLVLGAGALVTLLHVWGHRGFVLAGFDPDGARVQGVPVRALDALFAGSLALMVAVSTRALGVLPVFAFAVAPAMTALVLGLGMRGTMLVAAAVGALAGLVGYLVAFFGSFPVGASQSAVAALAFCGAAGVRLAIDGARRRWSARA